MCLSTNRDPKAQIQACPKFDLDLKISRWNKTRLNCLSNEVEPWEFGFGSAQVTSLLKIVLQSC